MKRKQSKSFLAALAAAVMVLLVPASAISANLCIYVSILPQKQIVQRLAGDRAEVYSLLPPGASPATYEPKPSQVADLSKAQLYFAIGVPFERAWLPRLAQANPSMDVVPLDKAVRKYPMASALPLADHHGDEADHDHVADHDHDLEAGQAAAHEDHDGHEHGHHRHGGMDPHVWLSPSLVRVMAQTVRDALIQIDPDGAADYQANYASFCRDVDDLDSRLLAMFADCKGRTFMVFHPAWGYFSRDYGLTQLPVEMEGKSPGPRELSKLIDLAKSRSIHAIFVQPQFSTKSAEVIAKAIDGAVVPLNPLAEDWFSGLLKAGEKLQQAVCGQGG
jgi:zinc transport system substrate-binding protein